MKKKTIIILVIVIISIVMLMFMVTAAWAKVNINTATIAELEALPGIGPAKAEAIVKYRETNGNFKSTADLVQVKGIGEKILAKISEEIEVEK